MKRFATTSLVAAFLTVFAASASATTFTLADYSVAARFNDPGLVMWVNELLATPETFELDAVGETRTFELFELGTNENALTVFEDTKAYPITVGFTFSAPIFPGGTGYATGETDGQFGLAFNPFQVLQLATVTWNNPLTMAFGTTGLLGIWLEEARFEIPGSATIDAKFKLLRQDVSAAPVPEPASLMLFGTGLAAGAAALRRRRARTTKA